jgi:hypothetical protein
MIAALGYFKSTVIASQLQQHNIHPFIIYQYQTQYSFFGRRRVALVFEHCKISVKSVKNQTL